MSFLDILKKKKKEESKKNSKAKTSAGASGVSKKSASEPASPVSVRVDASKEGGESQALIILKPRITEKASFITEDGAYTFDVSPRANKVQVRNAIQEVYGVKPVRVNMVTIPAKRVTIRNRSGVKSGGKKAIVYLKKGDKIEFV